MAKEIEKKVLLEGRLDGDLLSIDGLGLFNINNGVSISQGYLPLEFSEKAREVVNYPKSFRPSELRIRKKGNDHFMTVKGDGIIVRREYESEISEELFQKYWGSTKGKRVCKIRMKKLYNGYTLEVDYFTDRKLILGEMEFPSLEEAMKMTLPGKDVTEDSNYKNKNLAM